ncbi:hypothetical protein TcWFU_007353 [Taenia crassiceps]|uniref:RING-type domain-containing protein n=1 Tax=Taenia crassiceps TaxID=6207 RepID=A0ABR4QLW3_9CEST
MGFVAGVLKSTTGFVILKLIQQSEKIIKSNVWFAFVTISSGCNFARAVVMDVSAFDGNEYYMSYLLHLIEIKRFSQIPSKTPDGKSRPLLDEVCLLCCDACPSAILPCGHNFCRKCIDEWLKASFQLPLERHDSSTTRRYSCPPPLKNRQQCPLCRGPCTRSAEAWDLVDPPDEFECRREMSRVLLNLICNAGTSPHPDH